ncbi:glycosyltransferase (plasmid) [Leisingera sp. M527]|uniref:glycosyltransferase n=1 Tax=Leisingera sp. M527 TaxID=2867014 RepID=UPI0021A7D0BF|nr:glycosyltransferase [Leisingera sp. M527]UWQ35120.1 glycosyltransferase [Leisingera sp. M527]
MRSYRTLDVRRDMELTFLIVDNDDTPSSQEVFERETRDFPWPCRYVHEPRPGIPMARNRGLTEAGSEGFFAFVDDDETVTPSWLTELVGVAERTGAAFVQGPVQMLVDDASDAWWLQTLFFKQRQYADGSKRTESWTNNVLLDLGFTTRHGCRFDERLSFTGGEDTMFFQDVVRAGGLGAYAQNAWVCEIQPPYRLSWRWAVSRQFRFGNTRALTMLLRRSRGRSMAYCLVRGAGMIVVGFGWLASSIFKGKRGFANGIALFARAAGVLSGLFGARMQEYPR